MFTTTREKSTISCNCKNPGESADPRKAGLCKECGRTIAGRSTDESITEFFDRLEAGSFPFRTAIEAEAEEKERAWFRSVRTFCEHREKEGREKFGLRYLSEDRDLELDAAEEIADFIIYLYLKHLRTIRERGRDRAHNVLLQACSEVIGALQTAMEYRSKAKGSP